ncbi:hypothetical protein [Enterococcus sp. DIV0240a]|uniref:hypothetical protein n=1 Tax=Enterococcus sp. DIV0240a TaxID=2774651 RepID=UPI003D29C363
MDNWQNDNRMQQKINNAANQIAGQIATENRKNRKHLLKIEIAKATDRRVKAELEIMLQEIERKERINLIVGSIFFVLFIGAGFFAYNYFINSDSSVAAGSSTYETQNTLTSAENTAATQNTNVSTSETVDGKNLTADQIKQWVSAIENAYGVSNNYRVDISNKDGYAYATVVNTDAQVDNMGEFRVNEKGELEEAGYYYGKPGTWIVVSPSYMDVSHLPDKDNMETEQSTVETSQAAVSDYTSAVNWLKDHKQYWTYANKNAETIDIISINEDKFGLRSDELGSYYSVVINTNDDDGSVTGSGKQFKIYTDGTIQQRAGMHDFYTIYSGS